MCCNVSSMIQHVRYVPSIFHIMFNEIFPLNSALLIIFTRRLICHAIRTTKSRYMDQRDGRVKCTVGQGDRVGAGVWTRPG